MGGWRAITHGDLDNNGYPSPSEPTATPDSAGHYYLGFPVPFNENVVIRNEPGSGWTTTAPAAASFTIAVSPHSKYATYNFGNTPAPGSTNGFVFYDANDDTYQESNEAGIAGVTVFADANNNGLLDPGEISTVSNSVGGYSLTGIPIGNVAIRQVVPAGDTETSPFLPTVVNIQPGQGTPGPSFGIIASTSILKTTLSLNQNYYVLRRNPNGNYIDILASLFAPPVYDAAINNPAGLTINSTGAGATIVLDYTYGNPLPGKLILNGTFALKNLPSTGNPLAGTTIDLEQSTLYINYSAPAADPLAEVRGYLKNGYNAGAWNGTSTNGVIASSAAAANPLTNSIGYADSADIGNPAGLSANTIELRYTVIGDTNLDGTVGLSDLAALLKNYNTGTMWDQGDVTYGATTGLNDLAALLKHYNTSSPSASPATVPPASSMTAGTSGASVRIALTLVDSSGSAVAIPTAEAAEKLKIDRKRARRHR